ncbi:coiled-coil domain-containing protein 124 [Aethina tumida]|uniref:coiled-coil domain-containing protein 124 n=1 Tax=Aethina tumida TaxID=116153 RepID=UPI00096B1F52|nr:coiled-coil domain-containing protein 124 [Aethina tumida]
MDKRIKEVASHTNLKSVYSKAEAERRDDDARLINEILTLGSLKRVQTLSSASTNTLLNLDMSYPEIVNISHCQSDTLMKLEENKEKSGKVVARTINEVIALMNNDPEIIDRGRKYAFKIFESCRIKEISRKNPRMKLAQIKDMVASDWKRAPENPDNQRKYY